MPKARFVKLYILTGRCLVRRQRPAPQRSSSPAEGMPRWTGSGTRSAAGRSLTVEAAVAGT